VAVVKLLNIVMVSPFDLVVRRLWGPTIRLQSLAKELIQEGHRVVIAGPPPFDGERPAELDGVPLHYFREKFHRYGYAFDGKEAIRARNNLRRRIPKVIVSRFLELYFLCRRHSADVIYVNRAFIDTAYAAFAVHKFSNIPIVCDWDDLEGIHGFSSSFRVPLYLQLFETMNETVFSRCADATVVASRFLHEFAGQVGTAEERLYYAPSVADSASFHPRNNGISVREKYNLLDCKLLFYCGNLMRGNGVRVESVLETLEILVREDATYHLMIVGDGDLLDDHGKQGMLPAMAEQLGIANNVTFTGGVPSHKVPEYVAASDLCLALFPVNVITMSKSPLKVYEYMAAGKAVIARHVGEIAHCVENGVNGMLVYSDDSREYADRIRDCFRDLKLLGQMGKESRRLIDERFNWKSSAVAALQACTTAVGRNKSNKKRNG
jgi:glycosyltransferase involved in cell wall biosynthesis